MTTRIALMGAGGRMGTRIDALASSDSMIEVVARFHRENMSETALARGAHVVVDFSCEHGTHAAIAIARSTNAALLVGTTGLSEGVENILENPLNIVLTICKFKKFKFRFAYVLSFKYF